MANSLREILERWKDGDKDAIEEFFDHPSIVRKIKSLVKRYVHKPIKAGDTYQLSLGVVDGYDVWQTVRLIFLELVIENIDKSPEEIIDVINKNSYYAIQDELLKQHGYKRDDIGWVKPEIISWEVTDDIAYEDSDVEPSNYPYGFSEKIWNAIQQLKPRERELVCLYFGEDQTTTTIAELIGISERQVRRLLYGRSDRKISGVLNKIKHILNKYA